MERPIDFSRDRDMLCASCGHRFRVSLDWIDSWEQGQEVCPGCSLTCEHEDAPNVTVDPDNVALDRDLIAERTKSALDAKRRRGERIGGRKPTHTPEQVQRAMALLDTTDMTGQEIAGAVGMSRSRMYALVARRRAELEGSA